MIGIVLTTFFYTTIFSGIFSLTEILRKYFPVQREVSRKAAHTLCGLTALSFPYFIQSHWVVLGFVIVFGLLMFITKKKRLLKSIHDVERKSYGSFYYPVSIYLIFLLSSHCPSTYFISILTLSISDAFAALIGRKYGRIKFNVEGSTKSLEGCVIFFLMTFLCVHLPLLLMTDIGRANSVLIAFIIGVLLTGFEAISPTGSDNIIIPFATYFLLSKMTPLPLYLIVQDVYILVFVATTALLLSKFKASGLIGMMLINYAAFTLGNILWLIPLLILEILFYLLIAFCIRAPKEKYSLRTLFYMGLLPIIYIFLANTFKKHSLFFIPYLATVAAQIPISLLTKKLKKNRMLFSVLSVLIIVVPSISFYFEKISFSALFITLFSVLIIYLVNSYLHKLAYISSKGSKELRLRFASAAIGSSLALIITYFQGVNHVL